MDFDFVMECLENCREYYLFLEREHGTDGEVVGALRCLDHLKEDIISEWYNKLRDDALRRYCPGSVYIMPEEGK